MKKKIYRSTTKRYIAGVCGGIGQYLGVDPTFVRLGVVLISVFTALVPAIIAYAACALIIPEEPIRPSEDIIEQ